MTTTPLTMAEYEEAGGGGDTICQCGYRKSQHGPNHPAPDWLDDERRRSRNATPWLPPLSCDPRLVSVPRVGGLVTHYIVRNGPGGMVFTYDDLRDALVDLGRYVVACNAMHRSQERRQVLS